MIRLARRVWASYPTTSCYCAACAVLMAVVR